MTNIRTIKNRLSQDGTYHSQNDSTDASSDNKPFTKKQEKELRLEVNNAPEEAKAAIDTALQFIERYDELQDDTGELEETREQMLKAYKTIKSATSTRTDHRNELKLEEQELVTLQHLDEKPDPDTEKKIQKLESNIQHRNNRIEEEEKIITKAEKALDDLHDKFDARLEAIHKNSKNREYYTGFSKEIFEIHTQISRLNDAMDKLSKAMERYEKANEFLDASRRVTGGSMLKSARKLATKALGKETVMDRIVDENRQALLDSLPEDVLRNRNELLGILKDMKFCYSKLSDLQTNIRNGLPEPPRSRSGPQKH